MCPGWRIRAEVIEGVFKHEFHYDAPSLHQTRCRSGNCDQHAALVCRKIEQAFEYPLILGGTGFTGPYQVRYALERGHKVTVFNRGKTHPGESPDGVEQLIGDRNGQLDALKNRKWDVADR